MSKFSSFVVFTFGLALIAIMIVTLVRQRFFPEPPPPPEQRTEVARSNMAPLEVGTREQFLAQLDDLVASGGVEAVRDYVEKEWVPGRLVHGIIFSSVQGMTSGRILDREVRRCDREGAALMDKAPLLARVVPDLHVDRKSHLETWTRIKETQSFYITAWFADD